MWGIKFRVGFTLVELVVTMGVVAILAAAVVLINIPVTLQKARDGERKSELEAIRQALELYRHDNGGYPLGNVDVQTLSATLEPTYIADVPNDPTNTSNGYYYRYQGNGTCTLAVCSTYTLCALLEQSGVAGSCGTLDCDNVPALVDCNYKVANP